MKTLKNKITDYIDTRLKRHEGNSDRIIELSNLKDSILCIIKEHEESPTASYFYGWFRNSPPELEFMARCIETKEKTWRIDDHDKTYLMAFPASFLRMATQEEITKHINRKKAHVQPLPASDLDWPQPGNEGEIIKEPKSKYVAFGWVDMVGAVPALGQFPTQPERPSEIVQALEYVSRFKWSPKESEMEYGFDHVLHIPQGGLTFIFKLQIPQL